MIDDYRRLLASGHDETTVDQAMQHWPTLLGLWASTVEFHERFNAFPPKVGAALIAFREEHSEVLTEVRADVLDKPALAEEAVDLMVTLFGVLMAHGLTLRDLQDAMRVVIAKNGRKTTETHHVDPHTGKIKRKEKAE